MSFKAFLKSFNAVLFPEITNFNDFLSCMLNYFIGICCASDDVFSPSMQIRKLGFDMDSTTKGDRKIALDLASWLFNVVTSVGIILVNKALMATYGFTFGIVIIHHPFQFPPP